MASDPARALANASGPAQSRQTSYQERPFQCTYSWCQHRFNTEKEMQRHKKHDTEHFYCQKCDVDCEDWEDLTRHKVDTMAPYIEGKSIAREGDMPAHIACEFCGQDFKSFGGRKRHRAQMHPAEQEIKCPGCSTIHCRASDMVRHLEQGHCAVISQQDFNRSMQQKYINAQIMKAPEKVYRALGSKPLPPERSKITDGSDTLDQEAGGVSLLDVRNHEAVAHEPLEPDMSSEPPLTRDDLKDWPSLPSNAPTPRETRTISHLHKSVLGLSINDPEHKKDKVSAPSAHNGTVSQTNGSVWGGNSSKTLFPQAKLAHRAGDWNAIQLKREEEAAHIDDGNNLLKALWWDPMSKDYNIDAFYSQLLERFVCPFPDCVEDETSCATASDLKEHLFFAHLRRFASCTVCFKRFDSCAALIAHAESTQNCGIRNSSTFKKLIDDISGGYLKAKYVGEKKIYRPENALVKSGQPMGGVMSTQYIAKKPYE